MKSFLPSLLISFFISPLAFAEPGLIEVQSSAPPLSIARSHYCGDAGLFRVWVERSYVGRCESVRELVLNSYSIKNEKPKYDFIADMKPHSDSVSRVAIVNTTPDDDADFRSTRYRFQKDNSAEELKRVIQNFEQFHTRKSDLKMIAVLAGISQSERLAQKTSADGKSVVIDQKTGKEISPQNAYEIFRDENSKQKHYLTAVIEAAASLGLGTLAYNLVYSGQDPSTWRYHFNWESYREKFSTKGVRFDDNWGPFNTIGHPLTGYWYYLMARSNGLSAMESFLYTFAVSTIWEYLVEFRTVVSINDMVVTPVTAFVLGESLNQLGLLFARSSNTRAHRFLAGLFGQTARFNQWLHQNAPKTSADLNAFGIATDVWRRIDISAALGAHSSGDSIEVNGHVGFDSRIVQIDGYQGKKPKSHVIWGPEITDLLILSDWGKSGLDAFTLLTQVVYAGYYSQRASTNFLIGLSTGYELSAMTSLGGVDDVIGNVRVLGAVAEFDGYFRGAHLKFSLDFNGDFAMIQSFALNRYQAQSAVGLEGLRSVLKTQGYYYASGLTTNAQVALDYAGAEAGFKASYDTFSSIDGLDKNQEEATRDYPMTEQRLKMEAYLGYQFQGMPLKARLVYRRTERTGALQTESEKFQNSAVDQSLQTRVIVVF